VTIAAPWTIDSPAKWERTYLGHLVDVRSGATPSKNEPLFWDGDVPWVSPKDMKVFRIEDSEDHVSEVAVVQSGLKRISPGAVLMVTRGMILDHTVPIAVVSNPVTINQDLKALLPRSRVCGDFLGWLLTGLNEAILARVEEAAHGTKALRTEQWKGLPLAVPPLDVQRRIADFLDRKTAVIDELVAKKERLVALFAEKRQALIAQAVTKGLDPTAPMKASGVGALGALPNHWQVLPLRRVVLRFVDYRGRTPTKTVDGIPLITAGAVRNGIIDHSRAPEFMAPDEYEEVMGRGRPEVGDIVFTTEAPLGEVALVEDIEVAFAQRIILFKVDPRRIRNRFLWLYYLSSAGRAEVVSRASGSTADGIRADRLRASVVPVPSLEEQDRIIGHVTKALRGTSPLMTAVQEQIDRLREYRQALITAAVTGKLDVMESAP
jgi:type I restriction enzyme S subunit